MKPKKKTKKKVVHRHKWEVTGENDCAYCGYTEFFTCETCGAEKEGKDGKIYA